MKLFTGWDNLPRTTRDTWFMLGVIALVIAPMADSLPWWCSVLTAALLLWRAVLARRSAALPSIWWRLGLLILVMAALVLSFKPLLGRDAAVALAVVLLALKTLEMCSQRDVFVLFFLSFVVMLTNFFYSQSLFRAAAMLLALIGLLTTLVLAHMPLGRPSLWRTGRTALAMTALGAPIMLVLFMLFPRLAPLWNLPIANSTAKTGLSAEMTVGNIASLAQDRSIAMRVFFDGPAPEPKQRYFRGPVLSRFDGKSWRADGNWQPANSHLGDIKVQGPGLRYRIIMEPNSHSWLPTLDATVKAPALSQGNARMTADLQWLQARKSQGLLSYQATAYTSFEYGAGQSPSALAPFLALPPALNPRTRAWAQQLRQQADANGGGSSYIVQTALQHLRNGGFGYTLEPGPYGLHSADEFWFDRKLGFCEHIAAAFVILLRQADVPARIVTGYQGGERNPLDDSWIVRQSDAHAWAEVWLPNQGWLRVDPTASVAPSRTDSLDRLSNTSDTLGEAIISRFNPSFIFHLRASWDAANNLWNQWLLGYDQTRQLNLLKYLGFNNPNWQSLIYLLSAIVLTAGLLFGLHSLSNRSQQDPWLRLLQRAIKQLRQTGLEPPANATPRQLAQLLHSNWPPSHKRQSMINWLLQIEALRYAPGSKQNDQRKLAALQRQLRQLHQLRPSHDPKQA